jgi:hypothetical protein
MNDVRSTSGQASCAEICMWLSNVGQSFKFRARVGFPVYSLHTYVLVFQVFNTLSCLV